MKIILHGKNIELTPPLKEFVDEKVGSLDKYFKGGAGSAVSARVEVGRDSRHHRTGPVYYAEINLKLGKNLLRAAAEHLDVRTALDQARDEMQSQIVKFKTRSVMARRAIRKSAAK